MPMEAFNVRPQWFYVTAASPIDVAAESFERHYGVGGKEKGALMSEGIEMRSCYHFTIYSIFSSCFHFFELFPFGYKVTWKDISLLFWPKRSPMVPNWPLRLLFGDRAWGNVNCGRNSGRTWTKRWGDCSTNDAGHVSDNINNNLWQAVDSSALLWKPFLI